MNEEVIKDQIKELAAGFKGLFTEEELVKMEAIYEQLLASNSGSNGDK